MGVRVLVGKVEGSERAALVCSTSNQAFGPLLMSEAHAERVIEACAVVGVDARAWDPEIGELASLAHAVSRVAITSESHVDHGMSIEQLCFALGRLTDEVDLDFAPHTATRVVAVELPDHLGTLTCALYGPVMGDPPVTAAFMRQRPGRSGESRMIDAPLRDTRTATIIVGPHNGRLVLYTAFGGPVAPREPWDPSLTAEGKAESEAFWREHALATGAA